MSVDEDTLKRRYHEFLQLMPLTIAIAGLPTSEGSRNYTNDQLQARAQIVGNAFRLARQVVRDAVKNG